MASQKAILSEIPVKMYLGLVCFSALGHTISTLLRQNSTPIAQIASILTLVFGVLASQIAFLKAGSSAMAASLAVIVFGTAIELVGIGTGFPFGRYHYTDTWWPTVRIGSLGFFPISLPFAWLMIASACAFTFRLSGSKLLDALMAGSAACLLDLLMESTLAGKLGYWTWDLPGPLPGRAPWSNSFAWFGISFLAALILYLPDRSPAPSKGPFQVLAGQTLLMAALLFL